MSHERQTLLARGLGSVVLAIACAVLVGWAADVDALTRLGPELAPMWPLTAITLGLAALALLLLVPAPPSGRRATVVRGLALTVCLVGLVRIVDAGFGLELRLGARLLDSAGEMATVSAVAFAFLGVAMARTADTRFSAPLAQIPVLAVLAVGIAVLVGYALGVPAFYGGGRSVEIAAHSALGLTLLAGGVLLARPGQGLADAILGPTLGGAFARRTLPLAVLVPVLCGTLALAGHRLGLWDVEVAALIMTASSVALLVAAGLRMARDLDRYEELQLELEQQLRDIAERDPLTGVANRRRFEAELRRALAAARRSGRESTLALIDLDAFKGINDRHGHAAGDRALQEVARAIERRLRDTDLLGRIGGDEFALLLDEAAPGGGSIADDVEARVAEVADRLRRQGLDNALGASIGITPVADADSPAVLLQRADEAMYEVKRERASRHLRAVR